MEKFSLLVVSFGVKRDTREKTTYYFVDINQCFTISLPCSSAGFIMDCSRTIRKFRKQFFGMIFKTITMSCHISMVTVHPITAYSFLIYRFCRSSFYEVKKLHILYSYAYTLICSPAVFVYDKTSIVNLRSIFASISRVQTPSYNVQHPSASTPAAQFISFPRYLLKIINNNTTPFFNHTTAHFHSKNNRVSYIF